MPPRRPRSPCTRRFAAAPTARQRTRPSVCRMSVLRRIAPLLLLVPLVAGCGSDAISAPAGIHKIQHVIVIMQENRSFDSYFGTYPGADGIPERNGRPTVCLPD